MAEEGGEGMVADWHDGYNTGCPKIELALGYLTILSSLASEKHFDLTD